MVFSFCAHKEKIMLHLEYHCWVAVWLLMSTGNRKIVLEEPTARFLLPGLFIRWTFSH